MRSPGVQSGGDHTVLVYTRVVPNMKNITLSADEDLIAKARERARRERTTLNAEFRRWIEQYARRSALGADYETLMADLRRVRAGRRFSRDEMNER